MLIRWSRPAAGPLLRCAALLGVALGLLAVVLGRFAVARADASLLEVGRHLSALGETGLGQGGRGIHLNGQVLGFRVTTTHAPPLAVLDHFEAWCRGGSGAFRDELDQLDFLTSSRASDDSWRDLILREEDGERGYVGCVKTGVRRPSLEALRGRLERMAASGNLADLGRFHYAYAEPVGDQTRVVAVWTNGAFHPTRLFPLAGDAPGIDVPGVPRPPSGRRLLSAGEVGHPYGITAYVDSDRSVAELVAFYRRELPRNGWEVLADTEMNASAQSLGAQKGGRLIVLAAGLDDSGRSFVTIADVND